MKFKHTFSTCFLSGSLTGVGSSGSGLTPQVPTMTVTNVTPQMSTMPTSSVAVTNRHRHGQRFRDEIDLNNPLCQTQTHSSSYQDQGKPPIIISLYGISASTDINNRLQCSNIDSL